MLDCIPLRTGDNAQGDWSVTDWGKNIPLRRTEKTSQPATSVTAWVRCERCEWGGSRWVALARAHACDVVNGDAAGSASANHERPSENAAANGSEYCNAENEKQAADSVQCVVAHINSSTAWR